MPTTRVMWPSNSAKYAELWKVVELAGLASSARQAHDFVKFGLVSVEGAIGRIETKLPMATPIDITVRVPNRVVRTLTVYVVPVQVPQRTPRGAGPTVLNRKG